jgi:hypothetical protein
MVALMQEKHPFPPKVGADNAKELEFPKRGSTYTVATAGQKAGGRGGGISFFHGSEVAWWTNAADHFASSVQAVDEVRGVWGVSGASLPSPLPFEQGQGTTIEGWVKPPSEIWLETTSAGPVGEFHKRYMRGDEEDRPLPCRLRALDGAEGIYRGGDFVPDTEPRKRASFPKPNIRKSTISPMGKCCGAARRSTS